MIGISALLRGPIPKLGIPGVLDPWRGSVVAPPKLLIILESSTFCFRFADLCFAFLSPAAKMPRISSSGDDTVVEQTVPSTTVDPSSGSGATPSASSSDVNVAGDAGKRAMIVKPARKFGIKGLTLIRAPT